MKIAVTSRSFSRHPVLRDELISRYPDAEITFNDDGLSLVGDDLVSYLRGHDHAITALEKLTVEVFDRLPELQVVSKYGVGFDMIDCQAMIERNLKLGWTGGTNKRSVSELVISNVIALYRRIPQCVREVNEGEWRQIMGGHLSGRIVGIIGCGHVGKDLGRLLKAFGCRVLAHDIRDISAYCAESGVESCDRKSLLQQADIVTLHLPLDESTRNIIGATELKLMKSTALLINAARGGLINEVALKAALLNGGIAGTALDVFSQEPPEDRELIGLDNVLVTPHIGGSAEEAILAMGRAAIDGIVNNQVPKRGHHPEGFGGYSD